jgi:hypothetical protein
MGAMVMRIRKMKIAGNHILKLVCECERLHSVDIELLNMVQ